MSGWGCPHEVDGACERIRGAFCRPGMRGCILAGRVSFPEGRPPAPEWMPDHLRRGDGPPQRDDDER